MINFIQFLDVQYIDDFPNHVTDLSKDIRDVTYCY